VEDFCEHGNETSGSINFEKFLSGCTIGSFSRRAQLYGVSLSNFKQNNRNNFYQ
jgi:hypothetical protein